MSTSDPATSRPVVWSDELASLLSKAGRPTRASPDARYGLTAALAELQDWHDLRPNRRESLEDRASLLVDIFTALADQGPAVQRHNPTATSLTKQLPACLSSLSNALEATRRLTAAAKSQLSHPATTVAAFDDLLESIQSPAKSPDTANARLDVLLCVLRLADRPAEQICTILGAIVGNRARETAIARQEVERIPIANQEADTTARLPVSERLDLCRRYLRRHSPRIT